MPYTNDCERAVCSGPPRQTVASHIQETVGILKELLMAMGDTSLVLFAENPIGDPGKAPETKCLLDDAEIIHNQAKAALDIFMTMRKKLV